jgi:hypothetical protein
MADLAGRTDGPIRGAARESSEWAKMLAESEQEAKTVEPVRTAQPIIQPSPIASASPLVLAAAVYEEAKNAHTVARASLAKATQEEEETRAEEERAHAALLEAVAQIASSKEKLS